MGCIPLVVKEVGNGIATALAAALPGALSILCVFDRGNSEKQRVGYMALSFLPQTGYFGSLVKSRILYGNATLCLGISCHDDAKAG